jgi:hypothetical protein
VPIFPSPAFIRASKAETAPKAGGTELNSLQGRV